MDISLQCRIVLCSPQSGHNCKTSPTAICSQCSARCFSQLGPRPTDGCQVDSQSSFPPLNDKARRHVRYCLWGILTTGRRWGGGRRQGGETLEEDEEESSSKEEEEESRSEEEEDTRSGVMRFPLL